MLIYETNSLAHLVRLLPRRVIDIYGRRESDAFVQLRSRTRALASVNNNSAGETHTLAEQKLELTKRVHDAMPAVVGMLSVHS